MTDFWIRVLEFAQTTTVRVGTQLLADFGQVQASQKDDGSLVTQADCWSDAEIRKAIAATFPNHGVLTEETAHIFNGEEWCWIVDPLDGTTNFARGIPLWGISLGLLYQGTPIFGYVYLPPLGQSFHGFWYEPATAANLPETPLPVGAFLNHQPIHSSLDEPSKNHFFSLCARSIAVLKQPFPAKIRMLGVATYNLLSVATGAMLGGVEATPKIWDIAAIWAIAQAAGAVWVPLETNPIFPLEPEKNYGTRSFPTLVVSKPELVATFLPLVQFLGETK